MPSPKKNNFYGIPFYVNHCTHLESVYKCHSGGSISFDPVGAIYPAGSPNGTKALQWSLRHPIDSIMMNLGASRPHEQGRGLESIP